MPSTSELLDRFVDLFNSNRDEEAEQDFAPNGYGEEVGTNRRFTPQESHRQRACLERGVPGRPRNDHQQARRWEATARPRSCGGAPTEGSLMGRPATGKSVNVRAVVIIETNGNKVTRSAHYIDVAGMMAQLGAR